MIVVLRPKVEPGSRVLPMAVEVDVSRETEDAWYGRPTMYGPADAPGAVDPDVEFEFSRAVWTRE
jgi:hypothetical protein